MAGRFEGMSDDVWLVFEGLLPTSPKKRGRGFPHAPFRCVLNSILFILITGSRWCDIPKDPDVFASKSSSHRWLMRWQEDGTLHKVERGMVAVILLLMGIKAKVLPFTRWSMQTAIL